jgi:XisH protein
LPALDSCHAQVVRALRKAGWTIADKPKYIGDAQTETFVYIDIEAIYQGNNEIARSSTIYVEVKCFPRKNATQEVYIALGQYLIYRAILDKQAVEVQLYLAVPRTFFEATFAALFRQVLQDNRIMVVVVDLATETIVEWIE